MIALVSALSFSLFSFSAIQAQEQRIGKHYFETFGGIEVIVNLEDFDPKVLSDDVVLDHGCSGEDIHLYATEVGYQELLASGVEYKLQIRKNTSVKVKSVEEILKLKSSGECLPVMDFYPTYTAYVEMMQEFQNQYPDICEIMDIGTLSSGRKILVAHIGDDLDQDDDEPDFLYTSTMHGDEIAGFPLMLQLIDHLLCNYDNSEQIRNLVDNIDIYINPISNPDGTYRDDDETIQNPTRRNANNVDLNRNYPDPDDGDQPDNRPRQEEAQIFMDFADSIDFDISANFHGGAEVVNYPWDTFERFPADVDWWVENLREYADTAQIFSPDGYMEFLDNGITNGFAWFEVRGGRQDYMNYFQRCREFTVELSNRKVLSADQLPIVWEANRRSLLTYMEASLHGLRGVITDCITGEPVVAEVVIPLHDQDNSSVFSQADLGNFHRYLDDGSYEVEVRADGYETATQTVVIVDGETTILELAICESSTSTQDEEAAVWSFAQSETEVLISGPISSEMTVSLYDMSGRTIKTVRGNSRLSTLELQTGNYIFEIEDRNNRLVKTIFIK